MKVVIQRVSEASVCVEGDIIGEIGRGLMILVGIEESDNESDIVEATASRPTRDLFEISHRESFGGLPTVFEKLSEDHGADRDIHADA